MADLPDNAVSYRIAAVVRCEQDRTAETCRAQYGYDYKCPGCNRDLTRTVVTDVEVERITQEPFTNDGLWQEVPRG